MVNLGEHNIFYTRLVGKHATLVCVKCKKCYTPTDEDISTKNPNVYYKNCLDCREYLKEASRRYWERINKKCNRVEDD